jgi:hypothetical protein
MAISESWFDPNAIRGDIEQTLTGRFDPPVFSALVPYDAGSYVQLNKVVYQTPSPAVGIIPPAVPWEAQGNVYKLIYENVDSTIPVEGAIRIQISWMMTQNASIGSGDGSLRSVEGVISCWIISPKNTGTKQSLLSASRLRQVFAEWNRASDCGKQIRMYAVNGPRSYQSDPKDEYHIHVVTASITAMERVQTLR